MSLLFRCHDQKQLLSQNDSVESVIMLMHMQKLYNKNKSSSKKKLNKKDENEIDNMVFSESDSVEEDHKLDLGDNNISLRTPVQPSI